MEAGKNSVIYMGLISGPNKADNTCGPTMVTGTMDRGFTVYAVPKITHTIVNRHFYFMSCKGNVVPVLVMKTYCGVEG
jgi:hypothetical protein